MASKSQLGAVSDAAMLSRPLGIDTWAVLAASGAVLVAAQKALGRVPGLKICSIKEVIKSGTGSVALYLYYAGRSSHSIHALATTSERRGRQAGFYV